MARTRPTCTFEGCEKPNEAKGLCSGHYLQFKKGQPLRPLRAKAPHGTFTGKPKAEVPKPKYQPVAERLGVELMRLPADHVPETCLLPECPKAPASHGLCYSHFKKAKRANLLGNYPDPLGNNMGRKFILTDDLTGEELPEDTQPVRLSLGRTTYNLFLSEDSHGKLLEALNPFIENAETVTGNAAKSPKTAATNDADAEMRRKVRHWAIDTGYEYENAAGEKKKLGDRGRIPDVVIKAWEEAGSPDIS